MQRRHGRGEESSGLGHPPRVGDDRLPLADLVIIPAPRRGLDRLPHRRHRFEVVLVFARLLRPEFAQHADGGRRGVEDVHAQALGDAPGPPRVREGRHAFVHHARRRIRQWAVHDVGVTGDPADVCHAPVDVFGMDVEHPLGRGRDVGQIARDAVLCALGLPRRAARVHQEQRAFGRKGHRVYRLTAMVLEQLVDEEIATRHERRLGGILPGIALPDQDLGDVLTQFLRGPHRDVGIRLVIDQRAVAPVAVHRDQQPAARILNARPARLAAEPAEHLRVDDAQPRARQHGDRQLRDHRHVQGDPVTGLEAQAAEQSRGFIDPVVQLLIGDRYVPLGFRLGHEDEGRLVAVLLQVTVDAIVRRVDLAAHEPLPERRVAGIEDRAIGLEPRQHVGIRFEAVRELVEAEPLEDARVSHDRLCLELLGRLVILFLLPVHCDLRFADLG